MLLANVVRRINKTEITKCFNKSINLTTRRGKTVVSNVSKSIKLANGSLANVTSTAVFTNAHQDKGYLRESRRYYSSERHTKERKNDADEDEDLENWNRKLPRFDDTYVSTPSVYLMLKNALSTLLIRSYFDQQFNREEFLSGARQAVEVNQHTSCE